jgi:MFS family permease
MIVLIFIGIGFARLAKSRGLNQALWVVLACLSYFIGQVIAGFLIGWLNPNLLNDDLALMGYGFLGAVLAVGICYGLLEYVAKSKKQLDESVNSEMLDDNF